MSSVNLAILRLGLFYFSRTLLVVILLFISPFTLDNTEMLGNGDFQLFVSLLFYYSHWIISLAVPIAVFVATLLTFSSDKVFSKIDPVRQHRLSSILVMPFAVSLVLSILLFFFNTRLQPEANYRFRNISINKLRFPNSNESAYDSPAPRIGNNELTNSMIAERINNHKTQIAFRIENSYDRVDIHGYHLRKNSKVNYYLSNAIEFTENDFKWLPVTGVKTQKDRQKILSRVNENIKVIQNRKKAITSLRVELHKKYSLSFSIVFLFLMAAFSGFLLQKRKFMIINTIGFILPSCWLLIGIGERFASAEILHPMIAMWLLNLVLLFISAVLYPFARKKYSIIIEAFN